MGRDQDRTEEATPRHRAKALASGQGPRSQFVTPALAILMAAPVATAAFSLYVPWREAFVFASTSCAAAGNRLDVGPLASCAFLITSRERAVWIAAIAFLAAIAAGIGAAAAQGSVCWAPGAFGAKPRRLGFTLGSKRIFNAAALGGAFASALLIALLAVCTASTLIEGIAAAAASTGLAGALATMETAAKSVWWRELAVVFAFAVADAIVARRRFSASLRMTPREIREERAQTEARPEAKQRRRSVGQRRSRSLRIEAIRTATAVVTNPTRLAVALRYAPPEIDVPMVVARGADLTAAIVRAAARLYEVPVIESAGLARQLYAQVDVDEPIPEECYAAVAAIFAWIVRTRGSLRTAEPQDR